MSAVALSDAKNRLSELVDRVVAGEVIEITRRGIGPPLVAAQASPSRGPN